MNRIVRYPAFLTLFAALVLTGCASSGGTESGPSRFSNFLVIGIAGSYDSRAQFERVVVSGLRAEGVAARPYHLIVGGNQPLERDEVIAAVEEHGFDAVIVTRALRTESDIEVRSAVTNQKVTRKDEGFLKLFRYDHARFGDPLNLTVKTQLDFATDLYSAATGDLVWSGETRSKADNITILVDQTGKSVVRQLKRAGKIAR